MKSIGSYESAQLRRVSSPEMIRALFEAGADVFRFNFSHGSHADTQRLTPGLAHDLVLKVEFTGAGFGSGEIFSQDELEPAHRHPV